MIRLNRILLIPVPSAKSPSIATRCERIFHGSSSCRGFLKNSPSSRDFDIIPVDIIKRIESGKSFDNLSLLLSKNSEKNNGNIPQNSDDPKDIKITTKTYPELIEEYSKEIAEKVAAINEKNSEIFGNDPKKPESSKGDREPPKKSANLNEENEISVVIEPVSTNLSTANPLGVLMITVREKVPSIVPFNGLDLQINNRTIHNNQNTPSHSNLKVTSSSERIEIKIPIRNQKKSKLNFVLSENLLEELKTRVSSNQRPEKPSVMSRIVPWWTTLESFRAIEGAKSANPRKPVTDFPKIKEIDNEKMKSRIPVAQRFSEGHLRYAQALKSETMKIQNGGQLSSTQSRIPVRTKVSEKSNELTAKFVNGKKLLENIEVKSISSRGGRLDDLDNPATRSGEEKAKKAQGKQSDRFEGSESSSGKAKIDQMKFKFDQSRGVPSPVKSDESREGRLDDLDHLAIRSDETSAKKAQAKQSDRFEGSESSSGKAKIDQVKFKVDQSREVPSPVKSVESSVGGRLDDLGHLAIRSDEKKAVETKGKQSDRYGGSQSSPEKAKIDQMKLKIDQSREVPSPLPSGESRTKQLVELDHPAIRLDEERAKAAKGKQSDRFAASENSSGKAKIDQMKLKVDQSRKLPSDSSGNPKVNSSQLVSRRQSPEKGSNNDGKNFVTLSGTKTPGKSGYSTNTWEFNSTGEVKDVNPGTRSMRKLKMRLQKSVDRETERNADGCVGGRLNFEGFGNGEIEENEVKRLFYSSWLNSRKKDD